jgi:hypothetical protein
MSWILNLWNRLKGRGQFANPLARLVEKDFFPTMDLSDKFCDCNYYYIFTEGNCKQIVEDSEIKHDLNCLWHSSKPVSKMGFSFAPITFNKIKIAFPWMQGQNVNNLVNFLLKRHNVFSSQAFDDLSLNSCKWYLMYYNSSDCPIPLLTIRK